MIQPLHSWVARFTESKSLRSQALFLVIFISLVFGVANAVRGLEREMLWPAIWIGLPLGWLLAAWRISGWLAALLSALSGAGLTSLRVAGQYAALGTLLKESLGYIWRTLAHNPSADAAAMQLTLAEITNGQRELGSRAVIWLRANLSAQSLYAYDPLVVALVWGLLLWGLSVWAGWAIRRRQQPLVSVLPAVAALTIILAFVFGRIIYLMPMVAAMLMLEAQFAHDRRQRLWAQKGIGYAASLSKDINRTAFGLSASLVIFAALVPSVYISRILEVVWNFPRGQTIVADISGALGLEPRAASGAEELFNPGAAGILPRNHLINTAPGLEDQLVMIVKIQESQPNGSDAAYYWRGLSYDRYTGRGWSIGDLRTLEYRAGEYADSAAPNHQRILRQEVRRVADAGGLIYVSGTLLTADRDFRVAWRVHADTDEYVDQIGATIGEGIYQADSLLPVYGDEDLRALGRNYPRWITDRYLALPDSVPGRVLSLADSLTSAATNPYDQAIAIERYLRGFPYTLDVPPAPTDRDIADYFLFDLRKGYCDYYATAMVVLARAAGLPARLATGYIGGLYDEAGVQTLVTEDLAHSWPQIYFPGYGWIDFEPTAGRDAIVRPAGSLAKVEPAVSESFEPILAQRERATRRLGARFGIGALLLALGTGAVWFLVDGWRLKHSAPSKTIKMIIQRLYRFGQRLEAASSTGLTPAEFSFLLIERISNQKNGTFLVQAPGEIRALTRLHNRAAYSPRPPTRSEQESAIRIWLRLRRRLAAARLHQFVRKFRYNY